RTGQVFFKNVSNSRTGIENPVVADVDNDGNAEVVTVMNTEATDRCDDDPQVGGAGPRIPRSPNGIRVWGDPGDEWVSARRIWNEQSYHVTNVTEGGGVPMHEPESWKAYNGRYYNTYRSQPRAYGVAPDLTVVAVGVSSPNVACGVLSDTIQISFEIQNRGDLRVGPGVVVNFTGFWGANAIDLLNQTGTPLQVVLVGSLEPGNSVVLSVTYRASYNAQATLPARVRVNVDPSTGSNPQGRERECNETNNSAEAPVQAGASAPDLRLDLGTATRQCPSARVVTTVYNEGSVPASNVVVRFYAGDPSQGGTPLHDETIAGPIAPGQNVTLTVTIPELPAGRLIRIYGVVDPDNAITECNEANNRDSANESILCSIDPD
ncbi:MAG TPA: CARDB domain-containing protein, partial [Polyangiaceae bacterium]|nr:CARDB domain-containing protein [Polyangiaceae bacterium]